MLYKEHEIEEIAPWLVVVLTLVGAFLRMYQLGRNGLWLDETFSIWMAHHSIVDLLQWTIKIDQHPPLYYLLLHSWIALNDDTPYYARQLSAIFGAATIPMIYLIGKRISGVMTGLAAAVFLSFSLFNIYFAQETRMYTLLAFNASVAMYALVRLLTDPRAVRPIGSQVRDFVHAWRTLGPLEPDTERAFSYEDKTRNQSGWRAWISRHRWLPIETVSTDLAWAAFIVFSDVTLLSHNTAVLFSLAANLYVLGLIVFQRIRRSGSAPAFQAPSLGNWVKAQAGIFLLWSPWAYGFIQQVRSVDREFWIPKPTWDSVTQTFRGLLNSSTPGQASQVMTWILCALLCVGIVYYRKRFSIFLFLAALFAIPFLGELLVSIRRPIFYGRTLIWITIPLFLLLAAGIAQFRFNLLILFALGIFGTYNLFSIGDYYQFSQKEDWSDPAGFVANRVEPGDLILFHSAMVQIPFDY